MAKKHGNYWQKPAADMPRPEAVEGRLIFERGRERVKLDGRWRLHADMMRVGRRQRYWLEARSTPGGRPPELDYDAWMPVHVPGDWNTRVREMARFDGWGWYAHRFDFDPRKDERLFLRFGAVNYRSEVWLNGERLGAHEGGFTPFEFEVTGRLQARNVVVVLADAIPRDDGAPTRYYDWVNYGGITRSVEIVRTPRVLVSDFRVALVERSGRSLVRVEVELDGEKQPPSARFEAPELGISVELPIRSGRGRAEIPAEPERWSPEKPRLYKVTLSAGADRVADLVGFRTVERRGREILLNGRPVFLRGVSAHEERPFPGGGRTLSGRDVLALLGEAKALGCNFVRLAHYPHTEEMARAADRLGLMLWEEIPVYWGLEFWNRATVANCRQQMRELVRRDYNRASVVMWSVGNETPNTPERDRAFAQLSREARRLDSTRLIAAAFVNERHPKSGVYGVFNRAVDGLDVVGINEYFGWYDHNGRGDTRRARWATGRLGKPVIISEFGAEALAGKRGRVGERWTEEDQADVYRRQIAMISRMQGVVGMSPWVLVDFRSTVRSGIFQGGYNRKGLVAPGLRRKLAFGVLRKFYAGKKRGG